MPTKVIHDISEMRAQVSLFKTQGKRIALVPTMGFLHEGHASLMHEGRRNCDILVLSIFVNPTQFGVGEDFDNYPRDIQSDIQVASSAGVDIIFVPSAAAMYPAGFQTYVNVETLSLPLCGASRPGHFRGVTTVVCKLFGIVQPDLALFGRKDYQQLAVIRQMTSDLNLPVEIVGMPIIREADGLAMSSRNVYLSCSERSKALCLNRSLAAVRRAYREGERSTSVLQDLLTAIINEESNVVIDYVELRDGITLLRSDRVNGGSVAAVAVKIGNTRLIDNCLLGDE
jgi:pantoate--beta-alanine ligase